MAPERIRLIHLKSKTVRSHMVDAVLWDKVWTISHIWDRGGETTIPLQCVSLKSTSFSSQNRFNVMFERTRQIVEPRGAEYVWIDAACIDQDQADEKKEQISFMGNIFSKSAGSVAFGTLTSDDQFVEIAYAYEDGQKAWVCDWFERVWTFQELLLPNELLFVSGDHVLTREEVHLSILMMSPYLTSPHPSRPSPSHLSEPRLSIQDVLNALSPRSKSNAMRSLMQTSKRGCSSHHIHDKVYGILGVLGQRYSRLQADYKISLAEAVLRLMELMPPEDVLDTLTFNTLPPADNIHVTLHWSGMVMLDAPIEHPPYETDTHPSTSATVKVTGKMPGPTTVVHDAPLWKVVVTKPQNSHTEMADTAVRPWPSITTLSRHAKLTDDFSKVERSADYADAIGRAERSLAANCTELKPLLEQGENPADEFSSIPRIPPNRLGDANLFDQEVTVLVCRSKEGGSIHYGIVVTPNEDGSWHKVCTAAFSDSCVVHASRTRVESSVVIGK